MWLVLHITFKNLSPCNEPKADMWHDLVNAALDKIDLMVVIDSALSLSSR